MELRPLPIDPDQFWTLKRDNESFGVGYVPRDQVCFDDKTQLFQERVPEYLSENISIQLSSESGVLSETDFSVYQQKLESYPKAVWLTREFIKNGYEFDNPVGAHWDRYANHGTGAWIIHPGGTRQVIIDYFSEDDKIQALVFNTRGVQCDFEKVFQSFDDLKEFYKATSNSHYGVALVADHGTLIPHIVTDISLMIVEVLKTHQYLRDFFQTTNIVTTSFDVSDWGITNRSDKQHEIQVKIDTNQYSRKRQILKALFLLPYFHNWRHDGIVIKRTA